MPAPVHASFGVFALLLLGVGTGLVLQANVFPWPVGPESSTLYGFIFLGAAAYFLYGITDPVWPNAAGQLIGFLAYDLVLIGPFIDRIGEAEGGDLVSLTIYTAAVTYSGALATYYLFLAPETRVHAD